MPPLRKDIPQENTWNLEALYADEIALNADITFVKEALPRFHAYKGTLNTPENVLRCLRYIDLVARILQKIEEFVGHRADEDLGHDENNKRKAEVNELSSTLATAVSFIEPELAAQPEEFLQSLITDPNFDEYDFSLRQLLAQKKHLLSAENEDLLARFSEVRSAPHDIFEKVQDVDMKFPKVRTSAGNEELTNSSFSRLRQHPDREVRRQATEKFFETYHEFRTTFCETLRAHMKTAVITARARKYDSIYDAFLKPRGLTREVCDSLFAATDKHLHLLHRYCEVRRRKMGYEILCWHDLYVPIVGDVNNAFSYDEAVRMTLEALAPLGDEYVKVLTAGLTHERWVDRYENQGKRSGAYSGGGYDSLPYILMNFDGTLDSVSTLAHEAGHSMHTYLAKNAQPYSKWHYLIFLAEIASTFNEILLAEHLLKGADLKLRAFILNSQLNDIRTTFFRQTMFAEFEAILYTRLWEGQTFSASDLEKEYFKLNQCYYGPKVVLNNEIRSEWSFIPHFYYDFYVFQYATGFASALYFADQVLSGQPGAVENYLNFLKSGGSDYPPALLKNVGLDISKPDYLEALMKRFEKLLDEFDEIDLG